MSELLLALTGVVLLLTVVAVVVLGRDHPPAWASRGGVRPEPAPDAPLVLPEHPGPDDVGRIAFHVRRRGYDPEEVHAVLDHLARRLPEEGPATGPAPRA